MEDEYEEVEQISAAEVAWLASMHFHSQYRLYDAMLSILAALGHSQAAKDLQALHERGEFLYPPPIPDGED
jgi:hypothetical protein